LIDYYNPEIISADDYYPFGMISRHYGGLGYRFGFNGKENDKDVKGYGNQQDYGMRIYDPRLGRFLSVDPLTRDYAMLTPYQYASNNPVANIDIDGMEGALAVRFSMLRNAALRQPNKTNAKPVDNERAGLNLSSLKASKVGYEGTSWWIPISKTGPFAQNAVIGTYNQVLGGLETGSQLITEKGRQQFKGDVATSIMNGLVSIGDWMSEEPDVQMEQAKDFAVDKAEDFAGGILVGRAFGFALGGSSRPQIPLSPSAKVTIGLGLDADLAQAGGLNYKSAGWQRAGLTKVDWGRMYAGDEFAIREAFRDAVNKADAVRFDVTNFDPLYSKPGITNYEFNYINSNPTLLQKTTFIQNGVDVMWDGKNFIKK
jgi:RHS repeat-associated protein